MDKLNQAKFRPTYYVFYYGEIRRAKRGARENGLAARERTRQRAILRDGGAFYAGVSQPVSIPGSSELF